MNILLLVAVLMVSCVSCASRNADMLLLRIHYGYVGGRRYMYLFQLIC
jgi:hypothetical protein